jgi:hypothetical protein
MNSRYTESKGALQQPPIGLVEKILLKLFRHFDITKKILVPFECGCCGPAEQESLYLRRFFIFRSRWGQVLLHKIARSDDDKDPHDHPWDFTSLILKGGYLDEQYNFRPVGFHRPGDASVPDPKSHDQGRTPIYDEASGWRYDATGEEVRPGQIVHRSAEHIHRVVLHKGVCWSLVFTGPVRRPWGFITETAWVYWRKYLNIWDSNHA